MKPSAPIELNVLVVDDEPGTLKVLVDIVTHLEHCAVPAESAEEILKLLPYWTFHVALIDHNLPGMEGMMLGGYLRRNNPDMTIALVTGDIDPNLERRASELGLDFVSKPFRIADIVEVIDRHLAASEERERMRQHQTAEDFAPPIAQFAGLLTSCYDVPNVPGRVETRLVETLKQSLNNLRSPHRYNERDRVTALAGLLTAKVLGIRLPKSSAQRTLYEEYDALMRQRGRREEFSGR